MNNISPRVAVIMSAFNESDTITSAIESIVEQTWSDWHMVIVDDGSTDDTARVISRLIASDRRITFFRRKENRGLSWSLNYCIENSESEYIARMDADDVCYPQRLELQVRYLDANPNISVVGTNAFLVDHSGEIINKTQLPCHPAEIERVLFKRCPLIHPSVMYRRNFIERAGGYNANLRKAQDYDLWLRSASTTRYANLPTPLIKYRVVRSRPLTTDLWGFYVRVVNSRREKKLATGLLWAILTLILNMLTKIGYTPRAQRRSHF